LGPERLPERIFFLVPPQHNNDNPANDERLPHQQFYNFLRLSRPHHTTTTQPSSQQPQQPHNNQPIPHNKLSSSTTNRNVQEKFELCAVVDPFLAYSINSSTNISPLSSTLSFFCNFCGPVSRLCSEIKNDGDRCAKCLKIIVLALRQKGRSWYS